MLNNASFYKHMLIFLILILSILGCGGESRRLNSENEVLKNKISELEAEIKKLKETDKYYYEQGINLVNANKLSEAMSKFNEIVEKFPKSELIVDAKRKVLMLRKKQEQLELEMKRLKLKEEKRRGIPITIVDLLSDQSSYSGKRISITGYLQNRWEQGFEFGINDREDCGGRCLRVNYEGLDSSQKRYIVSLPWYSQVTIIGIWSNSDKRVFAEKIE